MNSKFLAQQAGKLDPVLAVLPTILNWIGVEIDFPREVRAQEFLERFDYTALNFVLVRFHNTILTNGNKILPQATMRVKKAGQKNRRGLLSMITMQ